MRLIDADETLMDAEHMSAFRCSLANMEDLNILIGGQETIDAVPVVRCRECKHWKPSGSKAGNSFSDMEYIGGCEFTKYYRRESDFCSYGKRKEGTDNG